MVGTSGPLPGVEVHVGLGYFPRGSAVATWDNATWDSSTWVGSPPVDDLASADRVPGVDATIVSIQMNSGRDKPLDRFRTATCTVEIDDPQGIYSPWVDAGTPTEYASIHPGIDLTVWVVTEGWTWYRFAGKVDKITDSWDYPSPDPDAPHRVTFQAHDMLGELAQYDLTERPIEGAGERAGSRLARLLGATGFGDLPVALDPGTLTLQGTTYTRNLLDEMSIAVDTEGGAMFVRGDGTLVFLDRNGLVGNSNYTVPQQVFGERYIDPGWGEVHTTEEEAALSELCYVDIKPTTDDSKVRNLITIGRVGGTPVVLDDSVSRALHGTRTYARTDLIHENDSDSTIIATQHLDQFAYATSRIESLTASMLEHPEDLDWFLQLGLLYMVRVLRRTRGFQIVADLQIQSIAENITASDWTITFGTFPAATGGVFNVARWDRSTWNSGLWGY